MTANSDRWTAQVRDDKKCIEAQRPGDPVLEGFRVFSQSDEDGIIAEIFRRIGTTNRRFVEFGAEVGNETNCRLLLRQGWAGLWIEGNAAHARQLKENFRHEIAIGSLRFVNCYVDIENINDIIDQSKLSGEIDLLSVDIDGNDYHVLNAIHVVNPRVIVMEHNYYRPPRDYVMPYDPSYIWDGKSHNFGASLVANVRLAEAKGYKLVATGLYSPNGFYVRSDLVEGNFLGPFDALSNWRDGDYEKAVNYPRTQLGGSGGAISKLWRLLRGVI